MTEELYSPGRRLAELAARRGDETAIVFVQRDGTEHTASWADLDDASNRFARRLAQAGVAERSFVPIGLPNCPEHVIAALAIWKLGACPVPLNASFPPEERDRYLRLISPPVVIGGWDDIRCLRREDVRSCDAWSREPLPDRIPAPCKAIGSGGSTGRPKLIVDAKPWALPDGVHPVTVVLRLQPDDVVLYPGPLYHNQAFFGLHVSLSLGCRVVFTERFVPELTLDLIERHRVTFASVVPTMLARMARAANLERTDLSSLRSLWHMAAPCPEWVKRFWIDRLGPERVWELWGATELVGLTTIRGDEWLEHPGSVGRGFATEFKILDPDGGELPAGEVGEIHSRMAGTTEPGYAYIGSDPAPSIAGGFVSVGDLGWLDDGGYLYIADRRVDLIVTGGANVYPAEVEAVLSAHPAVADVAVIGVPDDDLGRRVHAIVETSSTVDPAELDAHCRARLVRYKCPRTIELVDTLPRDDAGKIRRGALLGERTTPV